MARVLARRPLLLFVSQISPPLIRSIRCFAQFSHPLGKIPLESTSPSQLSQQISIAGVLLRYGFPQSQLHEFMQENRFLMNASAPGVENCVRILLSFGLSQKSLLSIVLSFPRVLEVEFLSKWQSAISELGISNNSSSLTESAFEQARKFRVDPDDFRRGAQVMKYFNFGEETMTRVLKEVPLTLVKRPIDIESRIGLLKMLGLEGEEMNRICCLFPRFLVLSVDDRLRPLFAELQDLGFGGSEVRNVLRKDPGMLLKMEIGELSRYMNLIRSLKCRIAIKEKILSRGHLAACFNVKMRVDCLCHHGLIRRDAFKVLFVEPRIIIYDLEDIEKKISFLVQKLGFCIDHLVDFPEYLGVNLEKQIIPRYEVIEHLRSQGGLGFDVGLKHLTKLSRHKFYNLFVKPYPECEKIFGGPVKELEIKPRHPSGMWKLFKPIKFSDTEEDVKNMKLFMESLP